MQGNPGAAAARVGPTTSRPHLLLLLGGYVCQHLLVRILLVRAGLRCYLIALPEAARDVQVVLDLRQQQHRHTQGVQG